MERRYQNTNTAVGVLLILLGLAFFVVTQGAFELNWRTTWPVFPTIAGGFLIVLAYTSPNLWRRAGMVLGGTIPLLIGIFFFLFNIGVLPNEMKRLWPVFPLIVGVAFFAAYFASEGQQRFYLIPASILTLVALVFGSLLWSGNTYGAIGQVWPIFLILAGVLLLFGNFRRKQQE